MRNHKYFSKTRFEFVVLKKGTTSFGERKLQTHHLATTIEDSGHMLGNEEVMMTGKGITEVKTRVSVLHGVNKPAGETEPSV